MVAVMTGVPLLPGDEEAAVLKTVGVPSLGREEVRDDGVSR